MRASEPALLARHLTERTGARKLRSCYEANLQCDAKRILSASLYLRNCYVLLPYGVEKRQNQLLDILDFARSKDLSGVNQIPFNVPQLLGVS